MNAAINAIIEFARADQPRPTKETVDAVNRYLRPMSSGRTYRPLETIVSHRTLMAGKLSILLIRELDDQQHEKADKALFDIANTYVRIRKAGSDLIADIAHNGKTTSVVINQAIASDYRKGFLSPDDLLNISGI